MSSKAITIRPPRNEDSAIACALQTRCSVCNHIHLATCQRGREEERGRGRWSGRLSPPGGEKVHVCVRASERAACHRDAPAALGWVGSGIVGSSLAPSLVGLLRREERWADGWVG